MVSRGGLIGMLETILLIFTAMAFGGIMEYTGMLARVVQPIIQRAKSDKSMMMAGGLTAIGVNIVAGQRTDTIANDAATLGIIMKLFKNLSANKGHCDF